MENVFIYMLMDIGSGTPFYVGATVNPKSRMIVHKNRKFKEYMKTNAVEMCILDEVHESEAAIMEEYWYNQLKSWGFELNQKDGLWYVPLQNNRNERHEYYYSEEAIKLRDERLRIMYPDKFI